MKRVPKKYRKGAWSNLNNNNYQDKFMIDKGLLGSKGAIEKVMNEVQNIEEYALEKIYATRTTQAKTKQYILDPIRENKRILEKERINRRFNQS